MGYMGYELIYMERPAQLMSQELFSLSYTNISRTLPDLTHHGRRRVRAPFCHRVCSNSCPRAAAETTPASSTMAEGEKP
jgi:hypothetical protein